MQMKRVFSDLESFEYENGELDLDCVIVPLPSSKGLCVRCPHCGLIMVYIGDGYVMCPECGIYG